MSIHKENGTVKPNSSNSYGSGPKIQEYPTTERASDLLTDRTVGVTVRRKFNLGDYESIDLEYHLGGQIADEVDALWAIDDLTDELRTRIDKGVGPEVTAREAIAKESFLTTPKNAQQQILRQHLLELGVDVDALRDAMRRGIDLRAVVDEFDRKSGGAQ